MDEHNNSLNSNHGSSSLFYPMNILIIIGVNIRGGLICNITIYFSLLAGGVERSSMVDISLRINTYFNNVDKIYLLEGLIKGLYYILVIYFFR